MDDIVLLWNEDRSAFREAFKRFSSHIAQKGYLFSQCDALADFARRAVFATQDNDVLRAAVTGLCDFGYIHQRWHVRSVLQGILQQVRSTEMALVALEGLKEAERYHVKWNLESAPFSIRTLHIVLREGIENMLGNYSGPLRSPEDLSKQAKTDKVRA